MRIVSLLPAATEIIGALGLMDALVGVSHECDFPSGANERPRVTHCPIHHVGLSSIEVVERAWQDLPLLQSYPHWDTLPAVRNGQVYAVDGNAYFSRPGPRIVDSPELLAGILHPDMFPDFAPQEWLREQVTRLKPTWTRWKQPEEAPGVALVEK